MSGLFASVRCQCTHGARLRAWGSFVGFLMSFAGPQMLAPQPTSQTIISFR